uniref:Uncharacterized protein n=1 Tax=Anguilla anguilla TaxID=7936 RepID=A0A0E9VQD0_ANGAN
MQIFVHSSVQEGCDQTAVSAVCFQV